MQPALAQPYDEDERGLVDELLEDYSPQAIFDCTIEAWNYRRSRPQDKYGEDDRTKVTKRLIFFSERKTYLDYLLETRSTKQSVREAMEDYPLNVASYEIDGSLFVMQEPMLWMGIRDSWTDAIGRCKEGDSWCYEGCWGRRKECILEYRGQCKAQEVNIPVD